MGNLSKHFDIEEFVPKPIYELYGAKSKWFINPKVVLIAEFIREEFGKPLTINNWYIGGKLQERGFRVPSTQTGARYSQHKFGNAIDVNVNGIGSDELAEWVVVNFNKLRDVGLTTIENPLHTKTWTHIDCRWTGLNELLVVNP